MSAAYERSAALYDLLYTGSGIKDYPHEAAELDRLIQDRCPGARTLVDVACGTGQHFALLRDRYEVIGLDVNQSMLEQAATVAPGVALVQADMRTFDLGRTFDAVICLFCSIGYMTTPDDLRSAVRTLVRHVAPRGVLIMDGWVRPDEWRDGTLRPPDVASDNRTLVVRLSHSTRVDNLTTLEMHHLVHTREGIEHFVEVHTLALVPTEDYLEALQGVGMKGEVIKDYMPARDGIVATRG